MVENMKWVRYGLRETPSKGRRECMYSCRINVLEEIGRYVATERDGRSVATLRPSLARARLLHSDRARQTLGCNVATERDVCSAATWRPSLARARSLRSDRATFFGLFSDVSCFFRWALHIDSVVTDFDPNTDFKSVRVRLKSQPENQ
ncbi:hypothetical protein F2Q68_00016472 [Brassica cretica]|uniref:Uncharacterized protein n=1 Tax=Brassica cretica TaxID=69181 RepID=A0A8S9HEJ9_BRACR|nr:hypothetical protein F2Q68_00016472 [Brassica cretica]